MAVTPEPLPRAAVARGLEDENRTLYGVIGLVSSSLELAPIMQGVVDLATDATGCHACFIYLLEDDQLALRAASPVFSEAVGRVRFPVAEGLAGWVARHRTPEFIRDRAMDDPRMKFVPLLREESFQSMVAVPILSRARDTIGVIVLHTKAPHEFGEDTMNLLVHIASLVSGAIENAQLYARERRRVDALTGLSELTQQVASATGVDELGGVLVRGMSSLLGADICQLLRLQDDSETLSLVASVPEDMPAPAVTSTAGLSLGSLGERAAQTLWPGASPGDVLVAPLIAGDPVGLMCAASLGDGAFDEQDAEIARAIAHLAAVALKRAELIQGLTTANAIKDLFEALAAGATGFAASRAAELRCDLNVAYVIICAEPLRGAQHATAHWPETAERLGRDLAALAPRSAVEAGPGTVRALLCFGSERGAADDGLLRASRELGAAAGAAVGLGQVHAGADEAPAAYREARDAAAIAQALLRDGGAITYAEVGAYRYLVQIGADDAPRDRMAAAVDRLIAYDRRRRTALLDTLERYLSERRSVIESARALYIHPNTLRQRLGRIEELTGLALDSEDLLSLELAIKLARLHGRPG